MQLKMNPTLLCKIRYIQLLCKPWPHPIHPRNYDTLECVLCLQYAQLCMILILCYEDYNSISSPEHDVASYHVYSYVLHSTSLSLVFGTIKC